MRSQEKKNMKEGLLNKELIKDKIPMQKKAKVKSLDPTRYGDWEKKGRAIDF